MYLDEELKIEETKDCIERIKTFPEKYNIETFYKKQHTFDTIVMMHNTEITSKTKDLLTLAKVHIT